MAGGWIKRGAGRTAGAVAHGTTGGWGFMRSLQRQAGFS
jgi:hypothetical protein